MPQDRLGPSDLIVGDAPIGLVDKDVRFARWDARKMLRRGGEQPDTLRRVALFEDTDNDALLDRMGQLHDDIAGMEATGLDRRQILERLLTANPDINDYNLLLRKAAWGEKLRVALHEETYRQDETGELWNDFVVGRINRALGGKLEKFPRYDGRFSYQIDTPRDVLYFSPESNARANDGPEFHIRGNRIEQARKYGFDTDQRYHLDIQNVAEVRVSETEGKIEVIKDMAEAELRFTYRLIPIGSTNQLELAFIPKSSS